MLTYEQLKEKCDCWTGYKRKPGTKPCADGSCVKEEVSSAVKHHAMVFGRMNPVTTGHEAVVNKLHSVAKEHGAEHSLVVSHSQDAKKNPLSAEQKVQHAKNAFPGTNVSSSSKEKPTILHHAADLHKKGITHLHVVAGSDREKDMHELLHKYNGKEAGHGHYNFKKITVHSSGERDPDAEGTEGMSASKMREHAASGNKAEFHKGAPSKMKPEHKDAMYNDVRKGMNIKEESTPYWKKPSFNKRMSQMAKQERLERERKEAEKKPVKEETADQQDDREKQLKRFKDQVDSMIKPNGPEKETATKTNEIEKDLMGLETHDAKAGGLMHEPNDSDMHPRHAKIKHMTETLRPEMGAHTYINDFIKSTNPRFNNKSKEERRKMAIGAYMAAKARGVKEEVQIDELSTDLLARYKTAAHASAKASDAVGKYKNGDKRFSGINKATRKQFDNDLKKHGQMKEARGSADKHWSIAQDHKEKASLATKGTEKYHTHMADHHDSMSQYHGELGQNTHADAHAEKAEIHHEKAYEASKSVKEGTLQGNIGGGDAMNTTTSAPSASTAKDTTMGKKIKGFKFFNGENDKQMNMNQPVKEDVVEGYQSHSGRSHGNPYGGGGFGKREREDDEGYDNEPHYKPVAPTIARKYIKGTPENKAAKAASKPINGHPTNIKEEDTKVMHVHHNGEKIGETGVDSEASPGNGKWFAKHYKSKMDSAGFDSRKEAEAEVRAAHGIKEEVEQIDEKSIQARRNKTYKNLMAASKGARVNQDLGMTPADTGHKTKQQMNKAIGRAISRGEVHEGTTETPTGKVHKKDDWEGYPSTFKDKDQNKLSSPKNRSHMNRAIPSNDKLKESATGNPGKGYHGACGTADEMYADMHKHVKNLTDGDDKTVKHYLDSGHGEKLAGREQDHDHIKSDFKKFMKYYRPEMHDPKTVNVDKVNAAGEKPHEEKFEKVKKVKEETMKSYKEFLQALDEKLIGKQKKLDKNHNGELDKQDFAMLRKEEHIDEVKMADLPSRKIQGKSYGADYSDPEGADETAADMKKADKKSAGRKTGQSVGSYKRRQPKAAC